MTDHLCHCKEPARWLLRVVPVNVEGVMDSYAIDSWAVCAEHVDEGASGLVERNDLNDESKVLLMRPEVLLVTQDLTALHTVGGTPRSLRVRPRPQDRSRTAPGHHQRRRGRRADSRTGTTQGACVNWWMLIGALVWAGIVFWLVYVTSEKWSPFDDSE